MPRRFGAFDYDAGELNVQIGDLVSISFKGRDERGIVIDLQSNSDYDKLQPITEILAAKHITKQQLNLYREIAFNTCQSLPSIIWHALVPSKPQKRPLTHSLKLRRSDIPSEPTEPFSGHLREQIAFVAQIIKRSQGQVLIICPDNQVASSVLSFIPKALPLSSADNITLSKWRRGEAAIAIGVRSNILHPAKNITDIVLIDEHSDLYRKLNKNPRLYLPSVVLSMQRHLHATIHRVGYSYPLSHDKQLAPNRIVHLQQSPPSSVPFVSDEVFERLSDSKASALLIYNRKGYARKLQCNECQYIPFCGSCGGDVKLRSDDLVCTSCSTEMWYPESCPSCRKGDLKFRQLGISFILKQLKKHFPHARSIEYPQRDSGPAIDLTTEKIFYSGVEFGRSYDMLINLSFDFDLQHIHFRSLGVARYKLERLLHIASSLKAESIVQTWDAELLEKIASQTFAQDELNARTLVSRPPISGEIFIEGDYTASKSLDYSQHSGTITLFPELDEIPELLHDLNKLDDSVKIANYSHYAKDCFTQSEP